MKHLLTRKIVEFWLHFLFIGMTIGLPGILSAKHYIQLGDASGMSISSEDMQALQDAATELVESFRIILLSKTLN